jgi:hypothetical protein
MHRTARLWAAGLVLALLPSTAWAQLGDDIPRATYFASKDVFYSGEYREAERNLRRERGVRAGQSNWIDSICYHAMLGEVLFHEGRNADALAEFDQACQVFLTYPNWLLQVKFQSTASGMRPDVNRARRVPPWGQSARQFTLGYFPAAEQVLIGDLNANQAYQTGGVVRAPMYWRVNIGEVMRMTALAIRRRNELLGPLAPQDAITKQLSSALASNSLAPTNHWCNSWLDVLRGITQIGMGKLDEADMLLGRSIVVDGLYDHPLTCIALLEQGRIAMAKGDNGRASQLLAEAGFSAFYFEDWGVLTESALNGWLNHMASNAAGVYLPLDAIAGWAQINRLQHMAVKLRLAQAESLLWQGQISAGAAIIDDASRRMSGMRGGLPSIHQLFLQAVVPMLQGKVEQGSEILARAIVAQSGVSLRNFQILRTNRMYDTRAVSPRVAVDFYKSLLADPTPNEWQRDPLDAMAVLATGEDAAFDRWFVAALERKDPALALEIAERTKRRQYLATRPFGGRLLALRAVLEKPVHELTQQAVLERQRILGAFGDYQTLVDAGLKIHDQLLTTSILATTATDTKSLKVLYDAWERNAADRQRLLAQIAVRRLPSSCEFPPLRTTTELQQSLGAGESLIEFHSAAGNLYGFVLTKTDARIWQLPEARKLRAGLADFLKAIGNYGANRQLSVQELKGDAWRDAAKGAFATIFGEAKIDLTNTTGLIVVPDDVLWYLPFEVLTPGGGAAAKADKPLADLFPVRYGPTGALAIAQSQPLRRPQHTGIVANNLKFGGDEASREALLQELQASFAGPIVIPEQMPEPANLVAGLLDQLVVIDDLASTVEVGEAGSLLPKTRGGGKNSLNDWIMLPIGGPEQIVLTGVATEAEQGLKSSRRGGNQARPGNEVFQTLCNVLAGGARTVLITRWRTSGRTNFDLVREFAKELPNAPASDAWQRACLLARESPLDAAREPRLKRSDETADLPTADHPFFWAGYLLVDTGPRTDAPPPPAAPANPAAPDAAKGKELPPPAKPGDADKKAPATEPGKAAEPEAETSPEKAMKDAEEKKGAQ